jgi:predicted NAD/FAD-binding protein
MKIAVIGSGISGLSAAYYLSKKYKVDLFEQNDHFGGHSYTYDIKDKNKTLSVDLGFIVFNELTYPNLIRFFKELNVTFEKSDMSFSVSIQDSQVEYGGRGLKAIFANKLNIFNLKFLKMIKEIIVFYKSAPLLIKDNLEQITLGKYLKKTNMSDYFINYHITPMVAAIWSMPLSKAKEMPLQLFLNFFINHGLFKLKNRPQWFTVTNRSRTYVNKVLENISGEIFKNYKISKIKRNDENVRLKIGHEYLDYDQVILATHADQSLKLLEDPTEQEKKILDKYKYVSNKAILHTDEMLMPKRKIAWSSWNSISKNNKTCVTYWLNNLQNLKSDVNYFLTLNPIYEVAKSKVIETVNFAHPYFNSETLKYQNELNSLQGIKRTWYCGAYFGYGFHEDGLNSAINLIKNFKI